MKENIRNLWNSPSLEEGRNYWDSWYSWVIRSSIGTMKDVARLM